MKYILYNSQRYYLLIFLCILSLLVCFCESTPDLPKRGICAHRGANDTHPENTLAAFQEAIRLGAHMIEFDVRLSKDEELVIMHDKTVDRTTNGSGEVADLTLSELKTLDAGSWKHPKFKGEKIPTLSETLETMPKNIWLNVHLKGGAVVAKKTAQLIVSEDRLHQAFLACNTEAAKAAREVDNRIMICNMERADCSVRYVDKTIEMKADFIQLNSCIIDATLSDVTQKLKEQGVHINYYGTNSADTLRLLFDAGIEFPLVDDLENMMKVAEELGIRPLKSESRVIGHNHNP